MGRLDQFPIDMNTIFVRIDFGAEFENDLVKENEKQLVDTLYHSISRNDNQKTVSFIEKNKFDIRSIFHKSLLKVYHNRYYRSEKQPDSLLGILAMTAEFYQKNYNDPFLKNEISWRLG